MVHEVDKRLRRRETGQKGGEQEEEWEENVHQEKRKGEAMKEG